jgi:hypothetical protein
MAEDSYLRVQRQYFASKESKSLGVSEKIINKVVEKYNRFLQKVLIGESPYVAEDLKITILSAGGNTSDRK